MGVARFGRQDPPSPVEERQHPGPWADGGLVRMEVDVAICVRVAGGEGADEPCGEKPLVRRRSGSGEIHELTMALERGTLLRQFWSLHAMSLAPGRWRQPNRCVRIQATPPRQTHP